MNTIEELKRLRSILSAVQGLEDDDQEYVEDARKSVDRLIAALAEQPAQQEQEPVAWVPYLSDRADGVSGHYAIARWNPRGYREVWNLRRHAWGAYSDDVLSLEEADTLLRLIEIPTRKVETPQPAQQEPTKAAELVDALIAKYSDKLFDSVGPHDAAKFEEDCNHIKQALVEQINRELVGEQPAQRPWVGLTDAETEHLWEISRAAMPRYHTFKTLIEKALRERNT